MLGFSRLVIRLSKLSAPSRMTEDFENLANARLERKPIECDVCCRDCNMAPAGPQLPSGWRWVDLSCHSNRSAQIVCPTCAPGVAA